MPDPDIELLARAEQATPGDAGVRECWGFIIQGVKVGWLSAREIENLIGHLRRHEGYGLDELLFDEIGAKLRVSFLDDWAECSPVELIAELEGLLAA